MIWAKWSFDISDDVFYSQTWANLAQIVTAVSVVFAALTFYLQRRQANALAIAEQIRMIRLEVLPLLYKSLEEVARLKKKLNREYVHIPLIEEFGLKWILEERTREAITQQAFWNDAHETQDQGDEEWNIKPQELLNSLEEFSTMVIASNTLNDPLLRSVRKILVSSVEMFAWPLVLTAPYDRDMYPALKEVYSEWSKIVDRTPQSEIQRMVNEDIKAAGEKIKKMMSHDEYIKIRFPRGKDGSKGIESTVQ